MTYWRQFGFPRAVRVRLFAAGLTLVLALAGVPSPAQDHIQFKPQISPARTSSVLRLDNAALPVALLGRRYAQTFPVDGGTEPYRFNLVGALPAGMEAVGTATTVLIEGVPQVTGDYPLTLSVTDALGQRQANNYVLHVSPHATNAPVTINVSESLKAADTPGNNGNGNVFSILQAIKAADSITVKLNGATAGNALSLSEAIKTADSITITLNGGTTGGNGVSDAEAIKAKDTITITLNGATAGGSSVSVPEAVRAKDTITITLNGATTGGGSVSIPEAIKAADAITITLNGATAGGSSVSVPEAIKAKDTITITLNGATTGGNGVSDAEAIKAKETITITLNGATTGGNGVSDAEAIKATDTITITLNGATTGGNGVSDTEVIKTRDTITVSLNGVATGGSNSVSVAEPAKATDTITVTLNGQPTNVPLVITPTSIPDAAYGTAYSQTFQATGGAGPATVTETGALPQGLGVTMVSGALTISGTPTVTGTFPVTITANDGTSTSQLNVSVKVDPTSQTINLGPLPTPIYGGSPFSVSATSTSGLPVTITYVSGPATGSGNGPYTATGAGTVNFTATQAGNANYNAAAPVNFSVTIASASQSITIGPLPTPTYGGAPFSVSATSNSGLPVTITYVSGPATGSGNGPYTSTGAGAVNFTATQAGNVNYNAAAPVNFSVTSAPASQSITIGPLPTPTYGGAPFNVSATSNSGLPVTITYVSGPATGSGNGPYTATGAGTVNFTATQAGNANYAAAPAVNFSVNVGKQGSLLAISANPTAIAPVQPTTLTAIVSPAATGSPTGSVTFYDNGVPLGMPVAIVGGQAQLSTLLLSGAQAISATYSGDGNFLTSNSTTGATVTVAPLDFTLTPLSPVTLSVVPGATAVVSFNITPLYLIYPGPVTFSVTGLPSSATYTITPTSLAANGGLQTVTVAIKTAPALARNSMPSRTAPIALAMLLPLLALGTLRRKRRPMFLLLVLGFVSLVAGSAVLGCGTTGNGYFGQAPQTYAVGITATSGTMQHTVNVTLQVQ